MKYLLNLFKYRLVKALLFPALILFYVIGYGQHSTVKKITEKIVFGVKTGLTQSIVSDIQELKDVHETLKRTGCNVPNSHWDWFNYEQKNVLLSSQGTLDDESMVKLNSSQYVSSKDLKKPEAVLEDRWGQFIKRLSLIYETEPHIDNVRSERVKQYILRYTDNPYNAILIESMLLAEYHQYIGENPKRISQENWVKSHLTTADRLFIQNAFMEGSIPDNPHTRKYFTDPETPNNYNYLPSDQLEKIYGGKNILPRPPDQMSKVEVEHFVQLLVLHETILSPTQISEMPANFKTTMYKYHQENIDKLIQKLSNSGNVESFYKLTKFMLEYYTIGFLDKKTFSVLYQKIPQPTEIKDRAVPKIEKPIAYKSQFEITEELVKTPKVVDSKLGGVSTATWDVINKNQKPITDYQGSIPLLKHTSDFNFDTQGIWVIRYDATKKSIEFSDTLTKSSYYHLIDATDLHALFTMMLRGDTVFGQIDSGFSKIHKALDETGIRDTLSNQLYFMSKANTKPEINNPNPVFSTFYAPYVTDFNMPEIKALHEWIETATVEPEQVIQSYVKTYKNESSSNQLAYAISLLLESPGSPIKNVQDKLKATYDINLPIIRFGKHRILSPIFDPKEGSNALELAQQLIMESVKNGTLSKKNVELWCAIEKMNQNAPLKSVATLFYFELNAEYRVFAEFNAGKTTANLVKNRIELAGEWMWRMHYPVCNSTFEGDNIVFQKPQSYASSPWIPLTSSEIMATKNNNVLLYATVKYTQLYSLLDWAFENIQTGKVISIDLFSSK